MTIIFLTMSRLTEIHSAGIYSDLMRRLRDEGHKVYIVSPRERKFHVATGLTEVDGVQILGVRTLNVQKCSVIEKGLGQLLIEPLYKRAIRRYLRGVKFDLITYSTPPITFPKVVAYLRRKNPEAMTYLQLKDIFPQNAVDLGMMIDRLAVSGERLAALNPVRWVKYLLYRSFRRKEKRMYALSDYIGCMSPANVRYVLEHNPEVAARHAVKPVVEICPNSYEAVGGERLAVSGERMAIREKYGLPVDRPIFIYGGNMGRPQGIPFLLECLKANASREDCHFVVVGDGTEFPKLKAWYDEAQPRSVSLFKRIPQEDYEALADSCDVGLIFLDWRFTIPNYPSRLLPYLMTRKPILACTDPNCDTGSLAEANGYGLWAPSNSVEAFTAAVDKLLASDLPAMGEKGYRFFLENYTVEKTYEAIVGHLNC